MPEIFANREQFKAAVGRRFGPTPWLEIDQSRIDRFAHATDDFNWLHVNPQLACQGPFGGTIAHGFLTLSLVSYFLPKLLRVEGVERRINYGLDRVRFPSVVRCGTRIRANAELLSTKDISEAELQFTLRIVMETQNGEKPACVADQVIRYVFRVDGQRES